MTGSAENIQFLFWQHSHHIILTSTTTCLWRVQFRQNRIFFPTLWAKKNRKKVKKRAQLRRPKFLDNGWFQKEIKYWLQMYRSLFLLCPLVLTLRFGLKLFHILKPTEIIQLIFFFLFIFKPGQILLSKLSFQTHNFSKF